MMQGLAHAFRPAAAAAFLSVAAIATSPAVSAGAAEIAPHHALYSMSLGATHGDAGVTGAGGTMAYQWGESCDGWTVEQRYRLKMAYAESQDVSISSNFVTWESKDGLRYRFNQKETRNGTDNDEIRGTAKLDGADKGGTVEFEKPQPKSLKLPPGVLFPSSHTIFLIDKAKAGENFISRQLFHGANWFRAKLDEMGALRKPGCGRGRVSGGARCSPRLTFPVLSFCSFVGRVGGSAPRRRTGTPEQWRVTHCSTRPTVLAALAVV